MATNTKLKDSIPTCVFPKWSYWHLLKVYRNKACSFKNPTGKTLRIQLAQKLCCPRNWLYKATNYRCTSYLMQTHADKYSQNVTTHKVFLHYRHSWLAALFLQSHHSSSGLHTQTSLFCKLLPNSSASKTYFINKATFDFEVQARQIL